MLCSTGQKHTAGNDVSNILLNHALMTQHVLALRFTLQLLEEVTAENFGDKINREPLHQGAGMEQVEQRSRLEV